MTVLDAWHKRHREAWALAAQLEGVSTIPQARRYSDPRNLRRAAAALNTVAKELRAEATVIERELREAKAARP